MKRVCYLVHDDHTPERAKFPVVDAHNHLWGDWTRIGEFVDVFDRTGVAAYCDLTSNVTVEFRDGGYVIGPGDITRFFEECVGRYPGRFYGFTSATFARDPSRPLFRDAGPFVEETLALMREHVRLGAKGLKILKELGLRYRDASGELVRLDDERLGPVWEEAGRLGVPVLMHQSDPVGFFEPAVPENEHYESLAKYPTWSFSDPVFPRKAELLERRDRMIRRHPGTTFILPHMANYPENLGSVSRLLDENPNVLIDFSARLDELGRQPWTAREFFLRYQDRILFGTDMPPSLDMYRCHFRFLETFDEHFVPPDYDGTFDRFRWHIHGIGLPDEALRKIYHGNILRVIPSLRELIRFTDYTE